MHTGATIPEARQNEMIEEIRRKYDLEDVTPEMLVEIANERLLTRDTDDPSSGQIIVEYFSTDGRTLFDFQRQWRQHFVNTMHPKYLPKRWSVNHENL